MMELRKLLSVLLLLAVSTATAQLLPNFGGERAGLSTLSFLKNDMNPRSSAMAGASVALSGDGYSVINNPAGLTDLDQVSFALSHQVIGGFSNGVNQSFTSAAIPLKDKMSTMAFSINALNSGAMEERTEFQPTGTGRQIYVSNIAIGASYARQLSAVFSAGISLKYIYEGLADFTNHNATVDVAFLYRTDFKDLQFAVMIQNFGGNSALGGDGVDIPVTFNRQTGISLDANTVPTVFSLGLSIVPWKEENQQLLLAAQLNHPNDNSENYRIGLEYQVMELFYARTGIQLSVKGQAYPTAGVGIRSRLGGHPLIFDYTINPTMFLGVQHGIGIRLSINNETR